MVGGMGITISTPRVSSSRSAHRSNWGPVSVPVAVVAELATIVQSLHMPFRDGNEIGNSAATRFPGSDLQLRATNLLPSGRRLCDRRSTPVYRQQSAS